MTATVVSLASRRPQPEQTCTCPQHRMWDLADRVREALRRSEGELLVPVDAHATVLEDVLSTIAAAMSTRTEAGR